MNEDEIPMTLQADGCAFALSDEVTRTPVRYRNRYGIEIAADLYQRTGLDESVPHPAIVIGPPHGGVKEQGPGVYAQELARRGFVAVGFDPSDNGGSGGQPRHVTSPEIFAEDFSAGVDFLGMLPHVDRERIGVIGICGSGGFASSAAQVDTRIKAVATSAMDDISRVTRNRWQDSATDDDRRRTLEDLAAQRWADVDAGEPRLQPTFPAEIPDGRDPITSSPAHINVGAVRHLSDIAPRPILLVTGDQAHSRYSSDTVLEQTTGPKELVVVPGARHIDLYDATRRTPERWGAAPAVERDRLAGRC